MSGKTIPQRQKDINLLRWAVTCLRSHRGYATTANELVALANRMERPVPNEQAEYYRKKARSCDEAGFYGHAALLREKADRIESGGQS